jgi:adenylate kinase family enzyme
VIKSEPKGILIFGASGSGTTTIGRELAKRLHCTHFDIDDYFWEPTRVPFTVKRPVAKRQELLLADIKKAGGVFVASGSMISWDKPFLPYFKLAVFVKTPTQIRVERLKKRELLHFGERVLPGGDMYQNHTEFVAWAAGYDDDPSDSVGRSLKRHEAWAKTFTFPVLRVNGAEDYRKTAEEIKQQFALLPANTLNHPKNQQNF